jgi:hypothetical protein
MEIHVALDQMPPRVGLRDADDFAKFKVVVHSDEHVRIPVAFLEQLAGDRVGNPDWRAGFTKMLNYAQDHGFLDDAGLRAHVEVAGAT